MITVDAEIGSSMARNHCALVPSHEFSFSPDLTKSSKALCRDWAHLEPDPYMADGRSCRSRRYGLYQLSGTTKQLTHIPDASFYQSIDINPLNGGKRRQFVGLGANTVENPFLHELILFDFAQLTANKLIEEDWLIGIHQIRIIAGLGISGNPTPEGTHRDDENYTSQHLIARHNIDGGVNFFYGNGLGPTRVPQTVWKQKSYFDSYYFDHSVWHSVSPIVTGKCDGGGYRDVLLIDFVKSSKAIVRN